MDYVPPDEVLAPKDKWRLSCVLYDEGAGGLAIAFGEYDKEKAIGMRWNGSKETSKLGIPQSYAQAIWFILPHQISIATIKELIIKKEAGNIYINDECLKEVVKWIGLNSKLY